MMSWNIYDVCQSLMEACYLSERAISVIISKCDLKYNT